MPELRKVTDTAFVEKVYNTRMKEDFADNELKPLSFIVNGMKEGTYEFYGLFQGEELLGYAIFVRRPAENGKFHYLFDYLAVSKEHRSEGYGSIFLKKISEEITDAECIVGEVEDPDRATDEESRDIQERRLQFYLRNGYLKTDITVWLFGVDYRILEVPTGNSHTTEELKEIYYSIYHEMVPPHMFKNNFHFT